MITSFKSCGPSVRLFTILSGRDWVAPGGTVENLALEGMAILVLSYWRDSSTGWRGPEREQRLSKTDRRS